MTRAAERGRPDVAAARDRWAADVRPNADPLRTVFVDETAANTTLDRPRGYGPRGYGPRGQRVGGRVPHGHYKSLTFTAALRAGGLTAPRVLDGPMTGDRFLAYVTECLVPTLRPGDTVVLDNLSCHKRAGVRAAVEAAGCTLQFLPPYSPDLNPIELAFSKLKRVLRTDAHRTVSALETGLHAAVGLFRRDECENYIAHCGYGRVATPHPNAL